MPIPVLVYGWYGHANVGDELFRDAFGHLMSDVELTFVDKINPKVLEGKRAVVFGGGSFLYKELRVEGNVLPALMQLPTAFVGVGVENDVHAMNVELMKKSSLIAVRSQLGVQRLQQLGISAMFTPDIVHSIPVLGSAKVDKSIMIVPNVETIPMWNSPSWATLAWERYKNEMAQFLDERVESGWNISFFSMCKNPRMNDLWAATEIVSKMVRRSTRFEMLQGSEMAVAKVFEEFSKRTIIVSQRYHGLVIAEMVNVPSIAVHHHDKIKNVEPFRGEKVPYYEFSKRPMHAATDELHGRLMDPLNIDFSELKDRFRSFLKEAHDGQIRRDTK